MMRGLHETAVSGTVGAARPATILVIGPGWLGSAIATASAERGDSVFTLSRGGGSAPCPAGGNDASDRDGVRALRGDITSADTEAGLASLLSAAPAAVDHVVLCVAPSRSRGDSHASLYPRAARGAVRLAETLGASTLLYTSSTGVYGATDGAVVREDDVIAPRDERQRALLDAEREILADGPGRPLRRLVLRVAGLYGPGRDPAARFRAAVNDPGAFERWTNFAWRDDVVSATLHLQGPASASAGHALFNCADGHPVRAGDIRRALGALDSTPPALSGAPLTSAPRATAAPSSNQRVSVDRLRATGWSPAVPSVFDGLRLLGHPVTRP